MDLSSILSIERTNNAVSAGSKKRVLEHLSQLIHASEPALLTDALFVSFNAREKLGSTGLGHGIAIPHCRVAECSDIVGALMRLSDPVDFESTDGEPVDVVFALVVPIEATQEHLDVLARLVELFNQSAFCAALRSARSDRELYDAAISFDPEH